MPIDYTLHQGETIDVYNKRIVQERMGTSTPPTPSAVNPNMGKTNEQVLAESTHAAKEAAKAIGTTFTPGYIANPIPKPSTGAVSGVAPDFPTPQAPSVQEQFVKSISADLERQRKQLENTYKQQAEQSRKDAEASQKQIDEITKQYKDTLEQAKPLTQPFRESLEAVQRDQLKVTKNFEENQKLVDELSSLLTEGNALIQQQRGLAIPDIFKNARVNKTMSDVNARAGIIQAVINARNGQISQAYTMIDRTISAITADRTDQLNYYNTLLKFYDTQKDDEGKKLLTLEKDQKDYLDKQVSLIENDLKTTQANADFIKKAMIDPDTAQAYGQAGVTLNDSPETINKKLAEYAYQKEVSEKSNDMAQKGYSYLALGMSAPSGYEVVTTTDSKGNTKQWYKKVTGAEKPATLTPTDKKDLTGIGFTPQEISDVKRSVNDFGIQATLKAIDNENQRLRVATTYNALDILDTVESEIESEKKEKSGVMEKKWWQFWK
mgnify:CR=1 FL=1